MTRPIYLDHHATTPLDSRVFDKMLPFLKEKFGNASSIDHIYGNEALQAVEKAQKQVADVIKAEPEEILFTSGATESDNLVLLGISKALKHKGNHIITSVTEHKAILNTCKYLETQGYEVTYLKVGKNGFVNCDELKNTINEKTILISIMAANNEVGSISPLKEIGEIAYEKGILFHTDAAQGFGHIPLDVNELNINLMSISGHKIYGPMGVGALFIKKGVKIEPIVYGGGQEKGLRSGTLNVPSIVGLGTAAEIANFEMTETSERIKKLRDKLYQGIASKVKVELNGTLKNRLTHNLSLYIDGINAKALINEVKDSLAISSGSACSTDSVKPSYVITALGYDPDRAHSTIRFGLGRFTTEQEINQAIEVVSKATIKLKNL